MELGPKEPKSSHWERIFDSQIKYLLSLESLVKLNITNFIKWQQKKHQEKN